MAAPMSESARKQLLDTWRCEEQQPFEGWDFSYLKGRMIEDEVSWSYEDRAVELMQQARTLLDMDTGGGERLLSFREHWPEHVAATEGYAPNIKLAGEALAPWGVEVATVELDHDLLPFGDDEFDLILNRHGALPVDEIARLLAPGGTFLTKQVSGMWAWDLLAAFGVEQQDGGAAEFYIPRLEAAGLSVTNVDDWRGKMRFTDVGAIVYYLKAIPWMVPGFSVRTHQEQLLALQKWLSDGQSLEFEIGTYMMEAEKGA